VKVLVLKLARRAELIDNKHPYDGGISVLCVDTGSVLSADTFSCKFFKDIILDVCGVAVAHDVGSVIFHRVDRPGLQPVPLSTAVVGMLKTDPVAALRVLDVGSDAPDAVRVLADVFGTYVYVELRDGGVIDPVSGDMRPLGHRPTDGAFWVRGVSDDVSTWLPLSLVGAHIGGLVGAQWAVVNCHDLLGRAPQYYLPRAWNPRNDGWIDDADLAALLSTYEKERKQ
jgi:hypothetical protein